MATAAAAAASAASGLDVLLNAVEAEQPHQMHDSTHLYEECLVSKRWKPLCDQLEDEGFLFIRGLIGNSDLQTMWNSIQRPLHAHTASNLTIDLTTGHVIAERSILPAAYTHPVERWKEIGQSAALWHLARPQSALAKLCSRLTAHTEHNNSVTLPGCTWLHAHATGAAASLPCTDYLFFRNHFPAIYGSPFRPRWSLKPQDLCPRTQVNSSCSYLLMRGGWRLIIKVHRCYPCVLFVSVACLQDLAHHPSCEKCSDVPLDHYTCWIPLHDLHHDHSRLEILPFSHQYKGYIDTGEQLPSEAEKALTSISAPASWSIPMAMHAGDVIIYNWRTVHRFTANEHKQTSCSLDIRVKLNHALADRIAPCCARVAP